MTAFVRRIRLAVIAALGFSLIGLATAADEPDAPKGQELKDAVTALKDVYEEDYKNAENDSKAKVALARKLFDGASKRKTAAMQYACYDEARRLAASGGDAKLALDALATLTTKFKNTPPTLTTDTLKLLGDANISADAAGNLLTLATDAANEALEREDYAGAVAMAQLRFAAAKKTEDPDVALLARQFLTKTEALKSAVDTIKTRPDDAAANESLGQYWTFTRGRWDVGLKYLAKGSNKELADIAKKDLANPKTAKERTAVADAWYKLAKDFKGVEHKRLIDRAWEWYSAALVVATGDEDLKPGERVKEIEKRYPELFDQKIDGHSNAVASVVVTPDGKTLISVSNDKSVRLWDTVTGKLQKVLDGHADWVGSIIVTPDGTRLVTAGGGTDTTIRVWDLKTQKEVKKLEGHTVAIRGMAFIDDGATLVSGSGDKTCRAWSLTTGKEVRRFGSEKVSVESLVATADGKYVLVGNDVGVVTVYDAKTGATVSTYDRHGGTFESLNNVVYTLATTPDGKTALSGARDKDIHVWELATGKEIARLKGHSGQIYQIALSKDGKQVLSASYDKTVRVWDLNTAKELKKFSGHTDGVQGACFSPDGRFAFSASWDKSIRKWRLPLLAPGITKKLD
jgi:WD40 repeat protein